jgi:hypothetical protein
MNIYIIKYMKMRTIKIFATIALIAVVISCTERMDVELTGTYTRLIVNSRITTDDSIQKVKLTKSADYFDNKPVEPVSDATVTISDGDTTYTLIEKVSKSGVYETMEPFKGIPGKTYNLSIKNANVGNGVTEYWAKSYLPKVAKIDSLYLMKITKDDFAPPKSQYAVKMLATDPAESQDFYLFRFYRNGINLTDTITQLTQSNDEFFNGEQVTALPFFIRYDYGMGSGPGSLTMLDTLKNGDLLTLELDCITKEYLAFVTEMQIQSQGSNPLSGPPANVSTNIYPKENAVGFFAAYSIVRESIIFNKEAINIAE